MQYDDTDTDTPMAVAVVVPDLSPATAVPISVNTSPQVSTTSLQLGRSSRVMTPQNLTGEQLIFDTSVIAALKDQGYTSGLIKSIARNNMIFPLRIWIVDNSGSMTIGDGHRIIETADSNNTRFVDCSRWAEIQETVEYHARIASLMESPTVFRLLNDPGSHPQQFSVAEQGPDFKEDLNIALNTIREVSPSGGTPLSEHIREIRANIMDMDKNNELSHNGKKVVIVIATDGLPTEKPGLAGPSELEEFKDALRSLEGLPIWIVVRLCTDEDEVVKFYNDLDSELELSMEVIDDFTGEATEVYEHNTWLNYALPLHRIREMGFSHKLFDLLDERPLTKDELREFFLLIFGPDSVDGLPDPNIDWDGFVGHINTMTNGEKPQWNPIRKKMTPWVDIRKLQRKFSDSPYNTALRYAGFEG